MGGGILGLPYAFYRVGLINGLLLNLAFAVLAYASAMMYLKVKDLTPRSCNSIYEISYLLLGRPFIFIVCGFLTISNLSGMLLYYIMLGDTISHLILQGFVGGTAGRTTEEMNTALSNEPMWTQVVASRMASILFVGALSLMFIFKRHLEELKEVTYVLLVVVFLFITLLLTMLMK